MPNCNIRGLPDHLHLRAGVNRQSNGAYGVGIQEHGEEKESRTVISPVTVPAGVKR